MIRLENMTNAQNLQTQPLLLHNEWVINNDFVFCVITDRFRQRIAIRAKTITFKRIKPRRMRAEIIKYLKVAKRAGMPISWFEADSAYVQVLRMDGCSKAFCLYKLVSLMLFGVASRLWWYWAVPATPDKADSTLPQPDADAT